jgi:tripartite-type tricarboxylate transporter receptor subunit TctC
MPLHQAGSLRILAVTGAKRSQFLPDVPTAKEAGYDVVVETWLGVFLPARMPDNIVRALSVAMSEASRSAAMKDNLAKFASQPTFQTPGQFTDTIKDDLKRWGPVVKASGFVAVD